MAVHAGMVRTGHGRNVRRNAAEAFLLGLLQRRPQLVQGAAAEHRRDERRVRLQSAIHLPQHTWPTPPIYLIGVS